MLHLAKDTAQDGRWLVRSGKAPIGVIVKDPRGGHFIWSITHYHLEPKELGPQHGGADTLEQAMALFGECWRRWLAWAELREDEQPG